MEKKKYVAPGVKVWKMENGQLLAALSTDKSEEPAHGGGMAKPSFFSSDADDSPARTGNNIWAD